MENDDRKNDEILSREAMWLSIFGVCAALGFISGLISGEGFLTSLGLVIGILCLVRISMIRRIRRVRLTAKLSQRNPVS